MVDESSVGSGCGDDCGCHGCDCDKANELVYSFLDNVLDESEKLSVQHHLDTCPGCRQGYDFEISFNHRLKSLKPVCMPEQVKAQIMLALGFPGISSGSPSQMGIPKGQIPKGDIPSSDFLSTFDDPSSNNKGN